MLQDVGTELRKPLKGNKSKLADDSAILDSRFGFAVTCNGFMTSTCRREYGSAPGGSILRTTEILAFRMDVVIGTKAGMGTQGQRCKDKEVCMRKPT